MRKRERGEEGEGVRKRERGEEGEGEREDSPESGLV